MTNQPKRTNQITIRYTDFEAKFLKWYADHIDTDRANAARHVLSSFLADHSELVDRFLGDTKNNLSEVKEECQVSFVFDKQLLTHRLYSIP